MLKRTLACSVNKLQMYTNNKLLHEKGVIRCYAIRRVNPFLGVLQVIENEGGRAVSANGVVWDIEVRADKETGRSHQVAYYRYGLWSLEDGLVSRPLAPHLDNDPLTHQCNSLIDCIQSRIKYLPFRLVDNRELWLFDKDNKRPLALLASATADSVLPSPLPKYWSSCVGANGVPSQRRHPRARELEEQVQQCAGFNIHTQWVNRLDDGSGIIEKSDIQMKAEVFPTFLLTEEWPETAQAKLATDFIEWISPSLLTLQHLSKSEREHMENNLKIQAISVEHHWHLYPEIIDDKCLQAARVQCRIQQANTDNRSQQ